MGYSSWLATKLTTAPESISRVMLLTITMAPVLYLPAGTKTVPPPALAQEAMASLKAAVEDAEPSFLAPKFIMLKTGRWANSGSDRAASRRIRFMGPRVILIIYFLWGRSQGRFWFRIALPRRA